MNAFEKICYEIVSSGASPKLTNQTTTSNSDITARLTDTSGYTGTHKGRFDSEGKGKGLSGRVDKNAVLELHEITNRKGADVRGVQH